MIMRPMKDSEATLCSELVFRNWGPQAATRAEAQMLEYLMAGEYAPKFVVGDIGPGVVGFAAYQKSRLMRDAYDLLWLEVHPAYQKQGMSTQLLIWCADAMRSAGGAFVSVVTQEPKFFNKFGFMTMHGLGNKWILMLLQFKLSEGR